MNVAIETIDHANPEPLVLERMQRVAETGQPLLLAVSYVFSEYWLKEPLKYDLTAFYRIQPSTAGVAIDFTVNRCDNSMIDRFRVITESAFQGFCEQHGLPCFAAHQGLPLLTVNIPKPWGQEIWYTGIEERGVAGVGTDQANIPLPWALSALPELLMGTVSQSPILLKILDPLADEVYGDLYFELHEEKQEVYVVTHIDEKAWPEVKGAIRFGFNQRKMAAYDSPQAFRDDFVNAVTAYEQVRREIDALLDECKQQAGIEVDRPVTAEQLASWLDSVPAALRDKEKQLRQTMDDYTGMLPLAVGDVVKVPTYVPHSLQHGVRTIEFQTPVYERLIVSFAQKVLTQDHWDTAQAAERMLLSPPPQQPLECLLQTAAGLIEKVVDFDDFEVNRVTINAQSSLDVPAPNTYSILIVIKGKLSCLGSDVLPEQAVLLPASCNLTAKLVNDCDQPVSFLLAYPKPH